jgi:polysaccharide deacetylase 2 family uncharacterized protein YibQ
MKYSGFDSDEQQDQQQGLRADGRDRGLRIRLWIAASLVMIIVLLFVAERFVTLVQPNLEEMQQRRDLASAESLQEDVERIFDDYGILPEWIRRRTVEAGEYGHVRDLWMLRVPRDLPFASLNLDLKNVAERYQGKAFAVENAKEAQIAVHITFRNTIRYSLVFNTRTDVQRKAGRIVLLVDGLANASRGDIERLLQSREPVACIVEPSKDAVALHGQLRKAGREIVLHLHFNPVRDAASRYELAEDMKQEEIQSHLRFIVRNFPACHAYYLTSERALGMQARIVEDEMRIQGVRKLESALLTYIDRTSQHNVMSSRMNDIASLAVREGLAVGVVELRSDVPAFLDSEMARLRKKGFSFIPLAAAQFQ